MKAFSYLAAGLLLGSLSLSANAVDLDSIDPDKARAYEAYVMTFLWPENMSSERIDYESVLSLAGVPVFDSEQETNTASTETSFAADIEPLKAPFDEFLNTFKRRTQLLSNERWTLIFPETGATLSREFHSETVIDGYAEFVAHVDFTLNRYLESDLSYEHYLFDTFTTVKTKENQQATTTDGPRVTLEQTQAPETMVQKHLEPAMVLKLNFLNKTPSKKLNYIDHPTIGTLIYFEPLELEDAMERVSMEQFMGTPN